MAKLKLDYFLKKLAQQNYYKAVKTFSCNF